MPAGEEHSSEYMTIGQVVALLSGTYPDVSHSSLRFLEREGLITPDRTAGGHRLFPPDQVERIKTIKNWQQQRLSLDEIKGRFAAIASLPELSELAERLLDLLVQGDRSSARELVLQIDDAGMPLESVFDGVLRPVLRETGERWARGELTVGQEKEISSFARDLIATLGERHQIQPEAGAPVLIAACVEGEYHELGLRMITALLRGRGYTVHHLGPSVSVEFLAERVAARRPAAVLLSAISQERVPAVERTAAALRNASGGSAMPAIIIGGAGIPADWRPEGNNRVSIVAEPTMAETVEQIEKVVRSGRT